MICIFCNGLSKHNGPFQSYTVLDCNSIALKRNIVAILFIVIQADIFFFKNFGIAAKIQGMLCVFDHSCRVYNMNSFNVAFLIVLWSCFCLTLTETTPPPPQLFQSLSRVDSGAPESLCFVLVVFSP